MEYIEWKLVIILGIIDVVMTLHIDDYYQIEQRLKFQSSPNYAIPSIRLNGSIQR